ncbi:alcohol dehydrogenase catalytic domain-containing protein [Streptomyces sp. NBC_00286]|uniref:alcohol dehydrogenase catalytic domain-containing protein n=1 Tax=Streptomyces sp. NBC_00286 TaxID=2975701 RepID=UPI002E2A0412|nr:alcohol dehydrogenase catalytic domain-containing protein [Streptomyces sp. NBC_00286]
MTSTTSITSTMKSVQTGPSGSIDVVTIDRPVPGPRDVLLRVRACGICGTDAAFLHMGGMPLGPGGEMIPIPLGHEPTTRERRTGKPWPRRSEVRATAPGLIR